MKAIEFMELYQMLPDRVRLMGRGEHLSQYNTIDVTLDAMWKVAHENDLPCRILYDDSPSFNDGDYIFKLVVEKSMMNKMFELRKSKEIGFLGEKPEYIEYDYLEQITMHGLETMRIEFGESIYYIYKLD